MADKKGTFSAKNVKNPLFSTGVANLPIEDFTQGVVLVPPPKENDTLLSKGVAGEVDSFLGQDGTELESIPFLLETDTKVEPPKQIDLPKVSHSEQPIYLGEQVKTFSTAQTTESSDLLFNQIPLDNSIPLYNPNEIVAKLAQAKRPTHHSYFVPSQQTNFLSKSSPPLSIPPTSSNHPPSNPAVTNLSKNISTYSPSLVIDPGSSSESTLLVPQFSQSPPPELSENITTPSSAVSSPLLISPSSFTPGDSTSVTSSNNSILQNTFTANTLVNTSNQSLSSINIKPPPLPSDTTERYSIFPFPFSSQQFSNPLAHNDAFKSLKDSHIPTTAVTFIDPSASQVSSLSTTSASLGSDFSPSLTYSTFNPTSVSQTDPISSSSVPSLRTTSPILSAPIIAPPIPDFSLALSSSSSLSSSISVTTSSVSSFPSFSPISSTASVPLYPTSFPPPISSVAITSPPISSQTPVTTFSSAPVLTSVSSQVSSCALAKPNFGSTPPVSIFTSNSSASVPLDSAFVSQSSSFSPIPLFSSQPNSSPFPSTTAISSSSFASSPLTLSLSVSSKTTLTSDSAPTPYPSPIPTTVAPNTLDTIPSVSPIKVPTVSSQTIQPALSSIPCLKPGNISPNPALQTSTLPSAGTSLPPPPPLKGFQTASSSPLLANQRKSPLITAHNKSIFTPPPLDQITSVPSENLIVPKTPSSQTSSNSITQSIVSSVPTPPLNSFTNLQPYSTSQVNSGASFPVLPVNQPPPQGSEVSFSTPPKHSNNIGSSYRLSNIKRPTYAPVPDLGITRTAPSTMTEAQQTPQIQGFFQPTVPSVETTQAYSTSSVNTKPVETPSPLLPPSFTAMAHGQVYRPVYHHWFFKKGGDAKALWCPFSMADSLNLEQEFTSNELSSDTIVATDGGRYDVEVIARKRVAAYWEEPPGEVRRCSWFVKGPVDSKYTPYDENISALLEEEYKIACTKNEWNRRVELADGEVIIIYSPNSIAHHQRSSSPDPWGNPPQMHQKPRIVKRGLDEFDIPEGEPTQVDHLLLVVHGIGKVCDLRFRSLVEVVDDFRSVSLSLVQSHYKTGVESGQVGRVEILPVEWHRALHTEAIDQRLADITLPSIPRARQFTNETLLDILFYTSPVFCERIVQAVGAELNRVFSLYLKRNPGYKGGVSLGAHSLGSLILFDMLCHQRPTHKLLHSPTVSFEEGDEDVPSLGCLKTRARLSRKMSYLTIGTAGTGQPFIEYPQLMFQPRAFFALGSPIGMFVTVRGIETLGEEFKFPTCPSFFNIFHPNDPVAYRIEALISPEMAQHPAVLIPHHKGRKRMHLELKDTMVHVTAALKQKLLDSVRNTWNTFYHLAMFHRNDQKAIENEVDKVIEDEILGKGNGDDRSEADDTGLDLKVGLLNGGRRIDYVLQEAPLETFNQYISAIRSHVVYWESEDTILMILKEIYETKGIKADNQVIQPILPFDLTAEANADPGVAYSHYTVSPNLPSLSETSLSRQSSVAK